MTSASAGIRNCYNSPFKINIYCKPTTGFWIRRVSKIRLNMQNKDASLTTNNSYTHTCMQEPHPLGTYCPPHLHQHQALVSFVQVYAPYSLIKTSFLWKCVENRQGFDFVLSSEPFISRYSMALSWIYQTYFWEAAKTWHLSRGHPISPVS